MSSFSSGTTFFNAPEVRAGASEPALMTSRVPSKRPVWKVPNIEIIVSRASKEALKVDVWSFGITILAVAKGTPISDDLDDLRLKKYR
jgi:hypothetical protein